MQVFIKRKNPLVKPVYYSGPGSDKYMLFLQLKRCFECMF